MMNYFRALTFFVGVATIGCLGIGIANAQSARECEFYAQDYARRFGANGQIAGGAARGALLGAGVGAFSGRAGRGAAIGAGVGAVAGGARRAASSSHIYNHAFRECMAGRARWTWINNRDQRTVDLTLPLAGSHEVIGWTARQAQGAREVLDERWQWVAPAAGFQLAATVFTRPAYGPLDVL
jgi:hypothetical protein